jgi:hypothetical protein
MDDFNYLAVLISIILGLGMTQLLSGLGRWVESRASVPVYAPTIVWIVTLLVMHVQTWWSMYGLRHHQDWTFLQFVVVLLQPTTLFLLTTAVVPSSASATAHDLKSSYFAQRRWFFGLLIVLLTVSVTRDIVLTGMLPATNNLLFHLLFFVIAVSGLATARESYHRLLAYSVPAVIVGYIALLYPELR